MSTEEIEPGEKDAFVNLSGDGSKVWAAIQQDGRTMEATESLNKIGVTTSPSVVVLYLFYIACAGVFAFFGLLVYHTWGAGTLPSETAEGMEKSAAIQGVCSAQTSHVLTQVLIVMLVIFSSGGASFFIYFYEQKREAIRIATLIVTSCQEVVKDRDHAINELVAKQKMDMVHITHLEKEGKERREI